jgi:hypothetical protein
MELLTSGKTADHRFAPTGLAHHSSQRCAIIASMDPAPTSPAMTVPASDRHWPEGIVQAVPPPPII